MSDEWLEFEELIKAELKYPEKWDTMTYPTVWHALWEAYLLEKSGSRENLSELVKAELKYPEKWDTMTYPTVWHALWEAYCWDRESETKFQYLECRIKEWIKTLQRNLKNFPDKTKNYNLQITTLKQVLEDIDFVKHNNGAYLEKLMKEWKE